MLSIKSWRLRTRGCKNVWSGKNVVTSIYDGHWQDQYCVSKSKKMHNSFVDAQVKQQLNSYINM